MEGRVPRRRTKFSELRKEVAARPGANERIAKETADALDEIRRYELRGTEGVLAEDSSEQI